jgi:hypothetical protein
MGRYRIEDKSPDLFSTEGVGDPSTNQAADVKKTRPRHRPALPKDLPTAIKYLNDGELDQLLRAATEEARQRGRLLAPTPETPTKIDPDSGGPSPRQALPTGRPTHRLPASTAARPLTPGASERRAVNVQGRGHAVKDRSTVWLIASASPRGSLIR